jgi:peptidoglycan hydrolase-like protein with peptidoglycan-binding domain
LFIRVFYFAWVVLLGTTMWASPEGAGTSSTKSAPKTSATSKTKKHATSHRGKRSKKTSWRRGQQKMDSARAQEIQEALIRQGYLDGKATGVWDQSSQKAMEKFQADNGWQSKTVPDSRALIKLGLGPNHDHLLNPDSAMTSPIEAPAAAHAGSSDPVSSSGQPQD